MAEAVSAEPVTEQRSYGDYRIDFVQTAEIRENAKIPLTFPLCFDIIIE